MLLDHIGIIFFPEVEFFRWCGRLAMPLFAFFIAEGCLHTSNPKRYFWRIFGMALFCQTAAILEQVLQGNFHSVYLNILFTFSLSIPLCFFCIRRKEMLLKGYGNNALIAGFFAILFAAAIVLIDIFCTVSADKIGFAIAFDYGAAGALLPAFALLHYSRKKRMISYAIGVAIFSLVLFGTMRYSWISLLALPILWFYNGKRGSKKMQPIFYLFYPAHIAVLYGISLLF